RHILQRVRVDNPYLCVGHQRSRGGQPLLPAGVTMRLRKQMADHPTQFGQAVRLNEGGVRTGLERCALRLRWPDRLTASWHDSSTLPSTAGSRKVLLAPLRIAPAKVMPSTSR